MILSRSGWGRIPSLYILRWSAGFSRSTALGVNHAPLFSFVSVLVFIFFFRSSDHKWTSWATNHLS